MRLLVLALFAASAVAQSNQPSPADAEESQIVKRLIGSTEASQQAWGAFLAANYRHPEFAADLLRLAVSGDWRVRTAAIDAMIRLKIDVPEPDLIQLADIDLDAALIFLAGNPDQYPELIRILNDRQLPDYHWVPLNSILAAKPPSGFAASLLRDWTIHLTFTVHDVGVGFGGGSGGGISQCGGTTDQLGFPPLSVYHVVEEPDAGDVILVKGPHPVGYRARNTGSRSWSTINRDKYRQDYLRYMAGFFAGEPRLTDGDIEWTTDAAFRVAAETFAVQIRHHINDLKDKLNARNALTQEEQRDVYPTVKVDVLDRRSNPSPALPDVSFALENE